ncbi:MAG: biotin--[acetyl-CoA-carboxylase] ligase [Eubacteriales bacterium]|nr:biotin--[acetyl-CoA-carboxylase] ligase [Eubacteriales bacterium]
MKYNVLRFDTVVSTNNTLKKLNAPPWTVVVANRQTGGKGRNGRSFSSPVGGLYMSIAVNAPTVEEKLFEPVKAAVAVCVTLSKYLNCRIKWPNDIVSEGKKICGILAEGTGDKVILGIGVNVNTPAGYFTENNLPHAGSIYSITGKEAPCDEVLNSIIECYQSLGERSDIINIYRQKSITIGKEVKVICANSFYFAKAVGITEKGELEVVKDGDTILVNSGEVSIRGSEYA